jgi:shikimate 5-dehydrogenase
MDLYCVMGNPVEHSRSPRIHARFAELCGQQMDYGRRLVPLGAFAEGIAAFRGKPPSAATARAAATSPCPSSSTPPRWRSTPASAPRSRRR